MVKAYPVEYYAGMMARYFNLMFDHLWMLYDCLTVQFQRQKFVTRKERQQKKYQVDLWLSTDNALRPHYSPTIDNAILITLGTEHFV